MIDKLMQIFKINKSVHNNDKRSINEPKRVEKKNKNNNESLTQMLAEYCRQYPQI